MNTNEKTRGFERMGEALVRHADWVLGIGVLGLLITLVTPVPPAALDLLLALNFSLSLLLLLATMNVRSASELSTFPTILLFATLLRLGLNVASTRLILTEGQAGSVITSFGRYVVGDNLMVGMIVFLILIIIQFVVITKGAGRISEVAARFVLDAMPGKQMAIDADLNGGLIGPDEARERRAAVGRDAEFYGAMDGASKFVRGDAIAGLVITALNLVGGIAIGAMASMSVGEAARVYSMLTIGDGLVSQIPALFVSTAAAILVTKSTSRESLGRNLVTQVSGRPRATLIAAGMMFVFGCLPGMPATPFFLLASLLLVLWRTTRAASTEAAEEAALAEGPVLEKESDGRREPFDEVEGLLKVDRISLEIGYRLIPLVQDQAGCGILEHVSEMRKRLASVEGIVLPPVRIRDNVRLEPGGYRVLVGGQELASGTVRPSEFLAMDGGGATGPLSGRETTDPAFGLPAWWIGEADRDRAELAGYAVIDATSVLITHLSEVIRTSLAEILTRDDVKDLVEGARALAPAVVDELVPDVMSYGRIQRILRNLLREGVSVRNMPAILEALADEAEKSADPEALTEIVRQRLGRALCEKHAGSDGVLYAVTLDQGIEDRLATAIGGKPEPEALAVTPAYLQGLVEEIGETLGQATRSGREAVVLVRSGVRRFIHELLSASMPKVSVLSYNEVVPARSVETTGIVRMEGV